MDSGILTTYQIAKILSVDISTVIYWINEGKLNAYRTPGGHRRVAISDLIDFLKKYNMPIPNEINVATNLCSVTKSDAVALPPQIQKKILIVDDDEGVIRFVERVIQKYFRDVKVETANDGFAAGEKIAKFKPDLMVLDIRMPGIDGFEVLKRLKKEKKMAILTITGYPSAEIKAKILKAGAENFLAKPFTPEEIKQKIETLLKPRLM